MVDQVARWRATPPAPGAAPLVTVVLPTYNRRALLERALRSVLTQTLPDFEVIVVDDGSTDSTREMLNGLGDSRIHVVHLDKNSGASRARNAGLRAARGELVAFLDSDDAWLPRKLELQVARLRESRDPRVAVVYCRATVRTPGRSSPVILPAMIHEGDVFDPLLRGWATGTLSLFIVRRTALIDVGGFDEGMPAFHHYDLLLKLAQASNHFVAVRDALAIKHEYHGPQILTDSAAQRRGIEALDRKWRSTVRRRTGAAACRRWRAARFAQVQHSQFMNVRHAVASGNRRMAWRYWWEMARLLRWSRKFWIHAGALLALGPDLYSALARARDAVTRRTRRGRTDAGAA